ncbi:MAG: PAS/PAC domain protein, partial [Candidatus Scalindua rubra]
MMDEKRIYILNVEDERVDHMALMRMVMKKGLPYDVDLAATIVEAIELLEKNRYHIILIDHRMPDGTGLDLLKKLKDVPSIIVTGSGDEKVAVKAMKGGAYDYIIKDPGGGYLECLPATIDKVLQTIQVELENRKLFQQISEAKKDWENTFDSISDLISILDEDFNIIRCNKAVARKFNLKSEDIIGKKCYEVFHGTDKPLPNCTYVLSRQSLRPITEEIEDSQMGGIFIISSFPRLDERGKFIGCVQIIRDITKQKEIEKQEQILLERIKESEEKYRELFEIVTDGIVFTDLEGNVLDCNKGFLDMLGYSIEEIRTKNYRDIIHAEWHDMKEKINKEQIMKRGHSEVYELQYIKKDGTVFPISVRSWLIKDEEGKAKGMWCIIRDITEYKQFEKEKQDIQKKMMVTSKLTSLGEIATGMAHEINQPLTYISSFIQGLKIDLKENTIDKNELKKELEVSYRQVGRIDEIIQHLRTFGRRDDIVNQRVCIETVLNNSLLLMGERIRLKNIELVKNIETDLPMVSVRSNHFEQVFINLFQNAVDAFKDKTEHAEIRVDI